MAASEKPRAESLPKTGQWPLFAAVIGLLKQAQRKLEIWIFKNFRTSKCSLCYFSKDVPDVWEHFSPSLESTGVISFQKPLKWAFIWYISHFSIWIFRIFVRFPKARIRYRNFRTFSHVNLFQLVEAFWLWKRVKIVVVGWNEPLDWASAACTEGLVFLLS